MALKVRAFDYSISTIPILLLSVGIAVIYSLVMGTNNDGLAMRQAVIALIGIVIMFFVSFSDYRFFKGIAWVTYLSTIVLLVLVNFFGKTTNGAMNWLDLKIFQLQPSELAKIFLIISLAGFFSPIIGKVRWRHIILSLMLLLPPLILILKEPDMGTAAVILVIYVSILFLSKLSIGKVLTIMSVIVLTAAVFALAYFDVKPFGRIFQSYQRERISVFIHPDQDPYGRGYNVRQAQITVGSGGILGKGLGKGSQSQLQFLPEPHTDFIFAGIAESFGFLGSFILLGLYTFMILRLIDISALARDNFGMMTAFGIASMFLTQLFISVGMNLGLLPVTGIPLPFLSYGGTSLLVSLFSIGLAQSIYIRHQKISF